MSDKVYGQQGWLDMTVPDAKAVSGFYQKVFGWTMEPTDMGGYSDYTAMDAAGGAVGGICHARGPNADMPSGWLPYFTVESVEAAVKAATDGGGTVVVGPKDAGGSKMAVIKDPSGAAFAIWQA